MVEESPVRRSEINQIIKRAKEFFAAHDFHLPPWAYWGPSQWKGRYADCAEIVDCMLGWDVTTFGSNDFARRGLTAFSIRNGRPVEGAKCYGEKVLIVGENQETPLHFHWSKMEDIINRGGGNLVIELAGSTSEGLLSTESVKLSVDGIRRTVKPGGAIVLTPGESVCITPGLYHRFYGEPGSATVLVGEVSSVNDDTTDNRWFEDLGRFQDTEEDEPPSHLLAIDYRHYL
jgi:D-lyxose ketol-isomerase